MSEFDFDDIEFPDDWDEDEFDEDDEIFLEDLTEEERSRLLESVAGRAAVTGYDYDYDRDDYPYGYGKD